ncbi:MAG: DUF3109 family protein, partial [Bacteroidia bacterium]|nr:DUF3109 family protein [Bacteroidia bacterium]
MLLVEDKILSIDLFRTFFACELAKCKGGCCVVGDSGAPVEVNESTILAEIYPVIEPLLSEKGKQVILQQGTSVFDADGDRVTPLVESAECAYVVFEDGIAFCAIEKAYLQGLISFRKPISCHLYPIRLKKVGEYLALNVEIGTECSPACIQGKKSGIRVFEFLQEA